MFEDVPRLSFRLPEGYSFDQELTVSGQLSGQLVVGSMGASPRQACVMIGKLAEYQKMRDTVWMDAIGAHAVFVMGKRRSGKTFTLGVLAEGLAGAGWLTQGEISQGVLLLDTMNVFMTMPFAVRDSMPSGSTEAKEFERWHLPAETPAVSVFRPRGSPEPPGIQSTEIAVRPCDVGAEEWAGVFGVDPYSDPMGHLIAEVIEKVSSTGYLVGQTIHEPNPNYDFAEIHECLANDPDIARYEIRTIEGVRRRFAAMQRLSIFSPQGMDIPALLRPGSVSVLLLRDIEQQLRSLMVGFITRRVIELRSEADRYERMAAVHRSRLTAGTGTADDERQARKYEGKAANGLPRSWILIDEAHNYVPSGRTVPSKEPLRQYINEGRNLGLSIVVATQQPSGLDPSVRRNADVLMIHSMSMRDDIQTAESMLNTLAPQQTRGSGSAATKRGFEDSVRSLPQGYMIVSNDQANRVFPVAVRPRVTVHGGLEY